MYKISIILPVHNEEKWLDDCLASLLNQNYTNFEIIIINDASVDNSLKIALEYKKKYPEKIKIITLDKLSGEAKARNKGLLISTGELIIQTDADALFPKNFLKKSIQYFIKDKKLSAIAIGELKIHPKLKGLLANYWKIKRKSSFLIKSMHKKEIIGFYMFRKKIIDLIGFYDETLISGCDFDLALRIKNQGLKYKWAKNVYFYHADECNLIKFIKRLFNAGRYNYFTYKKWGKHPKGINQIILIIKNLLTILMFILIPLSFWYLYYIYISIFIFLIEAYIPLIIFQEQKIMWKLAFKQNFFLWLSTPILFFIQHNSSSFGKMYAIIFYNKTRKAKTFDV